MTTSYTDNATQPKRTISEEFTLKRATAFGGFNLLVLRFTPTGWIRFTSNDSGRSARQRGNCIVTPGRGETSMGEAWLVSPGKREGSVFSDSGIWPPCLSSGVSRGAGF